LASPFPTRNSRGPITRRISGIVRKLAKKSRLNTNK
jgi:hypothetical protein